MNTRWLILYRGPLSSCNYACGYCPFAKRRNTAEELADDRERLDRFVDWVAGRQEQTGILITPWGEALVQRYYQQAMQRLSHLPNVWKVAAQTNLSFNLDSLAPCHRGTTALWCTYHPTETTLAAFLKRCARLDEMGLRYSVGVVGRKEALADIEALRAALPPSVYLWVNAWKREAEYYTDDDLSRILKADPLFRDNLTPHPSLGRACRAGHETFTVDGFGDMHRCHFISHPIGNIYTGDPAAVLRPTPCTNTECRCHIGYIHMPHLSLDTVYGDGILERIPRDAVWLQ